MIRIVLGTAYPFDETRIQGGVEAVSHNLANALAATGEVEIHIVSISKCCPRDMVEKRDKFTIHWVHTSQRFGTLKALTIHARRVAEIYKNISPDIIHAHQFSAYAAGARGICPLILTVHGLEWFSADMIKTSRYKGLLGLYRRLAEHYLIKKSISNADTIISIGGSYVPTLMGSAIKGKEIRYIPNPIVIENWIEIPPGHDNGVTILCVGTINTRKNQIALVRAFVRISSSYPESTLKLAGAVGDSEYKNFLIREARALGIEERICFLGQLNQKQLFEAYSEAAIVVCPSLMETTPMAIAEAMLAGRPVVATTVGAIPMMIEDGVSGYLYAPNDIEVMSRYSCELLSDKSLRRRLGLAARLRAKNMFASTVIADKTVIAYKELIERYTESNIDNY